MGEALLIRAEFLSAVSGYGHVVIQAARALASAGLEVLIIAHHVDESKAPLPFDIKALLVAEGQSADRLPTNEIPILQISTPGLRPIPETETVVWSFWEVDRLHPIQVAHLECAQGLIVSSQFNAEMYRKQIPAVPLQVVPLGIDTDVFHPRLRPTDPSTAFPVFGTSGRTKKGGIRKNVNLVIKAFEEFQKRGGTGFLQVKAFADDELTHRVNNKTVIVDSEPFTQYEMAEWYASLDLFINASAGEAFGLQNLEAMACGTPIAIAMGTGPDDYFLPDCGFPLSWNREASTGAAYAGFGASWTQPTLDGIVNAMFWRAAAQTNLYDYSRCARAAAEPFNLLAMRETLIHAMAKFFPNLFPF